jgi:acetylornithine aminotransferase
VDVTYFKVEDIEGIIGALSKGDVSSVIIEAIQGVGGLDMMSVEGLEKIARACREYDTVLIMDEVQCGYARSGRFFAFQYANIFPDIITMAKGMGNGFPIGGVLINTERMPAVTGRLGTTYGGNHLACAAGLAVLEVIESEKLIHNAARRGEELKSILNEVKGVKRIKGQGLMIGAEFDFPVAGLRKKLVMEYGLFTGSSGNPNLIRILPPLNITGEHLDEFSQKMNKAVASL